MALPPESAGIDLYCSQRPNGDEKMAKTGDPIAEVIGAACVPLDSSHSSGTLERAAAILAGLPDMADCSIHTAAILGHDESVCGCLPAHHAHLPAHRAP